MFQLSDLDGSNGFVLLGINEGDWAGGSLSAAGDINGDGFDDLLISSQRARKTPDTTNLGEAYVIFGGAAPFAPRIRLSSLDGTNGFGLLGGEDQDHAGYHVDGVGDFNGDGLEDIIVGSWNAEPNGGNAVGLCHVVFGSVDPFPERLKLSDLDGTNGFALNGVAPGDMAYNVAGAGDVNGDGLDDIAIGAHGVGETYVVFGSMTPFAPSMELADLDGSQGFVLAGPVGAGSPVSAAGDVNGDGVDDLMIADTWNAGTVYPRVRKHESVPGPFRSRVS